MSVASSTVLLAALAVTARAQTSISVDVNTKYQTVDGFGFSEAFGHASEMQALPDDTASQVLDILFDASVGAGMTILRNRIGSTETDSILPSSPGSPDADPEYSWDGDDSGQVWLSQKAVEYGVTAIYADAWSAPGFMKDIGDEANGGYLCGVTDVTCDSGDWRQAYADYLVQYVQFYADEGIPITHLGFLNEPDYAPDYSAMESNGTQAASFLEILAPTVAASGLNVTLTCCDAMGWESQDTMLGELQEAGAEENFQIVTSHGYNSEPTYPLDTELHTWQTEYADLSGAWDTNWYSSGGEGEGMTWALKIFTSMVEANTSGYLYWIGAEPEDVNSFLVKFSDDSIEPSKRLWAFAQWARYVRPGAVRVDASGGTDELRTSAFLNPDGRLAVQVINSNSGVADVVITADGFSASEAEAYVTDQENEMTAINATLSGSDVSGNVPSMAMVTFLLS